MRLPSGSIIINKDIKSVFNFSRNLAHFAEEAKIYDLEDYALETDDDIEGLLNEGDEFTIYAFAKYEGDKDFVIEFQVLNISENSYITFKVSRVGIYQNDDDEYEDTKTLPMAFIWEKIELGALFTSLHGKTRVKCVTYIKPSAGFAFKLFAWLANTIGFFDHKRALKQWAAVVEKHA